MAKLNMGWHEWDMLRERPGMVLARTISMWVVLGITGSCWVPGSAYSQGGDPVIPEALAPWVDWVLDEADIRQARNCYGVYGALGRYRCQWPTKISIQANDQGAQFQLRIVRNQAGYQSLPGGANGWPLAVRLNGEVVSVIIQAGAPAVWCEAGTHRIEGHFRWVEVPQYLRVPPEFGLVELVVAGEPRSFAELDPSGRLWLGARHPGEEAAKPPVDYAQARVFRRLVEGTPFRVETRLELFISGNPRALLLPQVLLPGSEPLQLQAPLPAHLVPSGGLLVEARSGTWRFTLEARRSGPVQRLVLPERMSSESGLPLADAKPVRWTSEVWSYQSWPSLRSVRVTGGEAVEPDQAGVPNDWQRLPAYRLRRGQGLQLSTQQRGHGGAPEDQLSLVREIWLDFSGHGYTLRDRLQGTVSQSSRLEVNPVVRLGRVSLNGQEQYLTRLPGSSESGVEIRAGRLSLLAESRLVPDELGRLPISGWRLVPVEAEATLHLPPAWRLLAARGVDWLSHTWVQQWDLMDLFIVLLIVAGFWKVLGSAPAGLALITLALTYPEPWAPQTLWLHLLVGIALWHYFRPSRLVRGYQYATIAALAGLGILFLIQQASLVLYPSLPRPALSALSKPHVSAPFLPERVEEPPRSEPKRAITQGDFPDAEQRKKEARSQQEIASLEAAQPSLGEDSGTLVFPADLAIQTGPGVPDWRWTAIQMRWTGPVAAEERMVLYLVPPWLTRSWAALGALFFTLLLVVSLRVQPRLAATARGPAERILRRGTVLSLTTTLIAAGVMTPGLARAEDFPPPELLQALRERLTKPPPCAPRCGHVSEMEGRLEGSRLVLELRYHAQADTAMPLPIEPATVHVQQASVDGQSDAVRLYRADGRFWVGVPAGRHELRLLAEIEPSTEEFQLRMEPRPGWISLQSSEWSISGLRKHRPLGKTLLLRRLGTTDADGSDLPTRTVPEKQVIPPFAQVQRTLILEQTWQLRNQVRRLSAPGSALALEIPLLSGEHVTQSEHSLNEAGTHVRLVLSPDEDLTGWSSVLDADHRIELQAPPATANYHEIWRLRASPRWHVESHGIPPIHQFQEGSTWLPEWHPWPEERVELHIVRPIGLAGTILTIDRSHLDVALGNRLTRATLRVDLRSSQGGQHAIGLPAQAQPTGLRIDGQSQPLQIQDGQVRFGIERGTQAVELQWRQEASAETLVRSPTVDLGTPSVNHTLELELAPDRWLLWAGGQFGIEPAVRFWGAVLILALFTVAVRRKFPPPIGPWSVFAIGLGFLPTGAAAGFLLVMAWFVVMAWRSRQETPPTRAGWFRVEQLALIGLSAVLLVTLLAAVQAGLLGNPHMYVATASAAAMELRWYQDRIGDTTPMAWVLSLPMWVYRGLMLAWALWLALAVVGWIAWGWKALTRFGFWRLERSPPSSPMT